MKPYDLSLSYIKERFNYAGLEEIGSGAHGQVFSVPDNPDQVIKISALYGDRIKVDSKLENVLQAYHHIQQTKPAHMARVYEFGCLVSGEMESVHGKQSYSTYYSVLERLQPLSDDEKKVFKTICGVENGDLECKRPLESVIREQAEWFCFNISNVLEFYKQLKSSKIKHLDFHRRNIMKNLDNKFKLIDFDRVSIGE